MRLRSQIEHIFRHNSKSFQRFFIFFCAVESTHRDLFENDLYSFWNHAQHLLIFLKLFRFFKLTEFFLSISTRFAQIRDVHENTITTVCRTSHKTKNCNAQQRFLSGTYARIWICSRSVRRSLCHSVLCTHAHMHMYIWLHILCMWEPNKRLCCIMYTFNR